MTARNADFTIDERGMYNARSKDGGRTWDVDEAFNVKYPRNVIVEAAGALLLLGTTDAPKWNLNACRSSDGGRTWQRDRPVLLFHSADLYVCWTVTVELPDGSLITSYASTTYVRQPPNTTTCEVVRWSWPG